MERISDLLAQGFILIYCFALLYSAKLFELVEVKYVIVCHHTMTEFDVLPFMHMFGPRVVLHTVIEHIGLRDTDDG